LVSSRQGETFIWVTLNPETTKLTPRTLAQVMQVVAAIKSHAEVYWLEKEAEMSAIELSKIDVAVDLTGSFLPESPDAAY
jgi:hypothetical protein